MHLSWSALGAVLFLGSIWTSNAYRNYSDSSLIQNPFPVQGDRPDNCPPCFNCNLEAFQCAQFGGCNKYNGKCSCPAGFGSDDCSEPLCGSLAQGKNRPMREGGDCACEEGWGGTNCNVCETDNACDALMPEGKDGTCYKQGIVVKENHQMCDVTNRKILDQLKEKKPQITFACNAEHGTCNFQCKINHVCEKKWGADIVQSGLERSNPSTVTLTHASSVISPTTTRTLLVTNVRISDARASQVGCSVANQAQSTLVIS